MYALSIKFKIRCILGPGLRNADQNALCFNKLSLDEFCRTVCVVYI